MVDGKMADILQGDSGSFCHYCNITRSEANVPIRIAQGFHIEKSYEDVASAWNSLESGEISYKDPRRAGQCHKPMSQRDLKYFAIVHCVKIIYQLVSGQTHTWSEVSANVKSPLTHAKKEIIKWKEYE